MDYSRSFGGEVVRLLEGREQRTVALGDYGYLTSGKIELAVLCPGNRAVRCGTRGRIGDCTTNGSLRT